MELNILLCLVYLAADTLARFINLSLTLIGQPVLFSWPILLQEPEQNKRKVNFLLFFVHIKTDFISSNSPLLKILTFEICVQILCLPALDIVIVFRVGPGQGGVEGDGGVVC